MTLVQERVRDATGAAGVGVGVAYTPEALSEFVRPDIAAAIWRRQPLPGFQSWIDSLDLELLPNARVTLRPDDARETITQICDVAETPDCPERQTLIDDAAALADIFAGLTQSRYLQLRFDVVTTNACRKFHVDVVTARLVCTYRGTGTQYGISTDGADPSRIFTVPTGAPILLRGKLWPPRPDSGLVHRSPPIEGTGETRLLLVLDPVSNLDDDR